MFSWITRERIKKYYKNKGYARSIEKESKGETWKKKLKARWCDVNIGINEQENNKTFNNFNY